MTQTHGPCAKPKANKERLPSVVWTDELRGVLAEIYSRAGLGEAAKAFRKLKPDWPTECLIDYIVEEANRLALVPQGTTGKALSDEEKEFILNHLSTAGLGWIAEQLHRPETRIRQFVQTSGYDVSEQRELFQTKDVAKERWATPRQVKRWVEKGQLWTEKRTIPAEFLAAFVEEYPKLIADKRLPAVRLWLRDLLEGHPAETASISLTELASKLGVRRSTVTYGTNADVKAVCRKTVVQFGRWWPASKHAASDLHAYSKVYASGRTPIVPKTVQEFGPDLGVLKMLNYRAVSPNCPQFVPGIGGAQSPRKY